MLTADSNGITKTENEMAGNYKRQKMQRIEKIKEEMGGGCSKTGVGTPEAQLIVCIGM